MRTYKQWIVKRQTNAEVHIMFALIERTGWTSVNDLMADIPISPWRFVGAINRLTLAKKVQTVVAADGESHMYALTAAGREYMFPKEPARE